MMRGTAVSGGQQRRATWNAFAGKPWQVEGGEEAPGTLSLENRGRWKAEKRHLEHFRWKTVAGGRQRKTPGTLSRENRGRWEAGKDTWNAFAGIPWQVGGGKGYLERFCGDTVAGGRRERLPGTL